MPTKTVSISPREQLALAAFLVQSAKTKGPVEERALLAVFDEFGLSDLIPKLGEIDIWKASALPVDLVVSDLALTFVTEALNGAEGKAPLQVLILRPLADRLSKASAN